MKEALSEIFNDEEALNNKPKHPRFWKIEHTWDFPSSIFSGFVISALRILVNQLMAQVLKRGMILIGTNTIIMIVDKQK